MVFHHCPDNRMLSLKKLKNQIFQFFLLITFAASFAYSQPALTKALDYDGDGKADVTVFDNISVNKSNY